MDQVYLLTGRPGTGKTSLIKQAAAGLEDRVGGFYTEEIRSEGTRFGFRLVTLDRHEAILAHIDISSRYRVGKYGVDVEALDQLGVQALKRAAAGRDVVVVDEIGKMELFSADFRDTVSKIIDSGKKVLGTIMLSPNPWADAIKQRPGVKLVEVTRDNRNEVRKDIDAWLKDALQRHIVSYENSAPC